MGVLVTLMACKSDCMHSSCVTCSKGMPLVSGSKKYTNSPASMCHKPNNKKTPTAKMLKYSGEQKHASSSSARCSNEAPPSIGAVFSWLQHITDCHSAWQGKHCARGHHISGSQGQSKLSFSTSDREQIAVTTYIHLMPLACMSLCRVVNTRVAS